MDDKPAHDISAIEDPGAISIDINPFDERQRFFIVKSGGDLFAYRNICPHTGAPLNWSGDNFLSRDKSHIQCSLHGAMFRIDDGYCVAGPCVHASLCAVPFKIVDGKIIIND